ncbi:DUF4157 domain-containing protein [Sinorhizobium terangae]|uniref:eCIS core domain-containing protein n=1 Tax=Sinorhizobium terangae TaxID=110322 RepID=UPI0024B2548E|nr:DUF4157 domain-containing protein [Sinorhizobium terangae]WFU49163.1 DUF4157 domain-containing protein [Sinorhizobium terangae]
MMIRIVAIAAALLAVGHSAKAWDPIGDLTNPGRILKNIEREGGKAIKDIPNVPRNLGRELENVGKEIDRIRLEFQAVTSAPALEAWLRGSRDTSRPGAGPIPQHIRQALGNFYDNDIYDRVRFKIGDSGAINLANASIQYGEAEAVTLIDTVVFANANGANDPILWAHELWHVQQFRDWDVRDFAIRYLRSWNSVENEAYSAANRFAAVFAGQTTQRPVPQPDPIFAPQPLPPTPPPPPPPTQRAAFTCYTNMGACPLAVPIPAGMACYCPSVMGPIWGGAQ